MAASSWRGVPATSAATWRRARAPRLPALAFTLALALAATACSEHALRAELYRGEIRHHHEAGNAAYARGDLDTAAGHFERIAAIAPGYEPARIALAHVALARGDARDAATRYRALIDAAPAREADLLPYLAFAETAPEPVAGEPSPADLAAAVAAARAGDDARLRAVAAALDDPFDWIARRRSRGSAAVASVTEGLVALAEREALAGCPACARLAGCWLVDAVAAPRLPLVRALLDAAPQDAVARELAWRLALAHERAGERAAAVKLYMGLLPDPRARARLER